MKADVLIVGGGVAGAALAARLAPSRQVILLEREDGFGAHATGRSAAEWSTVWAEGPTRALTVHSGAFLENPPAGFSQVPLRRLRGNVVYTPPGEEAALAPLIGGVLKEISTTEAARLAPFLDVSALGAAAFDRTNAEIDVDALLHGYLRAARAGGAQTLTSVDVSGAERGGGTWRLGDFEAPILVDAAGPWADGVARACGVAPIGLTPTRRTAITFDGPEGLELTGLPSADDAHSGFYLKPEGGRLMACPGDRTESEPCDAQPDEYDVALAAWMAEQVTGRAVTKIAARWAGLRTYAPDDQPAVGWDPDVEGFFWMAGLGGSGLMTSPALSDAAASILETGETPGALARDGITAAALSPARFRAAC